jgi:hypothetical protein
MAGERLEQTLPEALTPARKANRHVERPPGLSVPKQNGELRRRGCDRARLAGRAHSRPAADGLGVGRPVSQRASSEPGRWRTERTPYLKEIRDCLSPSSPTPRPQPSRCGRARSPTSSRGSADPRRRNLRCPERAESLRSGPAGMALDVNSGCGPPDRVAVGSAASRQREPMVGARAPETGRSRLRLLGALASS